VSFRVSFILAMESFTTSMCSIFSSRKPGAFYVMDRGYIDFARLYALHQAGAFFVTRAKSNFDARRVYSAQTDRTTGVICEIFLAFFSRLVRSAFFVV